MKEDKLQTSHSPITLKGQEDKLISLAMNLVEKRIREGTATSQEVTHFLKLGSTREKLEQKRLEKEIEFTVAKKINLESAERMEQVAASAIEAMKRYSGVEEEYDEDL